ncbi:9126_t:CDS:1 [Cetraspora pellucida]|uniref:9126_t:CDS:1 n=1 Tax=Cetraspora pellucida TaxID=1433469 RepID=A0ACA9PQP8_9GLOM|nr:9126_t:CDS:1 [Cetraspora pellucida]
MSSQCKEIKNTINEDSFNEIFTKEIDEFNNIRSKTFLSLSKLIAPNVRRGKTKNNPPRAQNSFVIFRRDFTAYWISCLNRENNMKIVSNIASNLWKGKISTYKLWKNINICNIVKIYNKVSEFAKRVHSHLFLNYKYNPKKKSLRRLNLFQSYTPYSYNYAPAPYNYTPYNYASNYYIQHSDNNGSNFKPKFYIQQLDIDLNNLKNIMNQSIIKHIENIKFTI